ncbi:MAG TPA: nucleotidyltransferase [Candidatus Baltobacteraceae bacterium]|nr:nucleotidyltransferase [Candidatus Baltobacteraceae bacterium]
MEVCRDWIEALQLFTEEGIRFLIVGAHARARYARPRATGDLDLWVEPTAENAERVLRALARFGAPLEGVSRADFEHDDTVFQIGVPPLRIDVLTGISGVTFDEAWTNRQKGDVGGIAVSFIGREQFLQNKRAAGRPKDLADIEDVEREAF